MTYQSQVDDSLLMNWWWVGTANRLMTYKCSSVCSVVGLVWKFLTNVASGKHTNRDKNLIRETSQTCLSKPKYNHSRRYEWKDSFWGRLLRGWSYNISHIMAIINKSIAKENSVSISVFEYLGRDTKLVSEHFLCLLLWIGLRLTWSWTIPWRPVTFAAWKGNA